MEWSIVQKRNHTQDELSQSSNLDYTSLCLYSSLSSKRAAIIFRTFLPFELINTPWLLANIYRDQDNFFTISAMDNST